MNSNHYNNIKNRNDDKRYDNEDDLIIMKMAELDYLAE